MKFAPMKKTIYSLGALQERLTGATCNFYRPSTIPARPSTSSTKARGWFMRRRGPTADSTSSTRMTKPSFWLWPAGNSPSVACRIKPFPQFNSGPMSRILGRLRTHGRIMKASHCCYKYYLTVLGKQVVALDLKLKQLSSSRNLRPHPAI